MKAWVYITYSQCYGLYGYVSFENEANSINHVQGIKKKRLALEKLKSPLYPASHYNFWRKNNISCL